jgi:hypothetical protein
MKWIGLKRPLPVCWGPLAPIGIDSESTSPVRTSEHA